MSLPALPAWISSVIAAEASAAAGVDKNALADIALNLARKLGVTYADIRINRYRSDRFPLARISPVDREYMQTLGRQTYRPVNGYVKATSNISVSTRAKTINDVITACEKAKVIGAGFHQARGVAGASATKNGNFSYEQSSIVSLSTTARTANGTSSGYFLRSHFDVAKLDTARVANEAIRKALEARNPHVLEPGVYPALLEPQAVADLLGFIAFSFDARSAEEGRSPLSAPGGKTKLGEKIFDERLNIYSDPWHLDLPGSQSAQGGLPAQKLYLVRNGVVENLIYSRFWAKQKGKEPTRGPVNSVMESSQSPVAVEDMIKSMDRGLLLGRFWYTRGLDPRTATQTGLTRDGIWYIEKGKIQYPVKNFRFTRA